MATAHLIDASPYIFRAYFSLPSSMRAPDGAQVNAVYGFANFLLKLVEDEAPTHLAVTFDESLSTSFRNEIYPPYKQHRELPPAQLEAQLSACQEVAAALGAATFVDDRYEADDLIGALAAGLLAAGHGAVVVTSDKDLSQLVGESVELLDFAKGERLDAAAVEAKFGVRPDQIVDYLALAGDAVDNIPGVKGVGAKTAVAVLVALGDLESVYADLDTVAALPIRGARSVAARLEADREAAFLSRRLAVIAVDAPAGVTLDDLAYAGADPARVDPLFERLGFGRIRDRVRVWKK